MQWNSLKILALIILPASVLGWFVANKMPPISGAPPYGEAEEQVPDTNPYSWLDNWKRPDGPAKVGLQAGHWKSTEAPDELERLRTNTGSSGGGKWEWEVNLAIAEATAELLRSKGVVVDILPATVPPAYWADVFVAVHADGNLDKNISGYKAAAPWRDWTGKAGELVAEIESSYEKATGLPRDPNVSRNMRGYYAFSFWRYTHAVHPKTVSAILETGFLTNAGDRRTIVSQPKKAAEGLAVGILAYLETQNLLDL